MYEDYFSIDDILSTQERIHCQLLVHVPKLIFLESSSSSLNDDKQEEENFSSLIYSRIQREIFDAEASVVV
jgi:hypothetical protein